MRLRLKSHSLAAAVMVFMFGGIVLGSTLGYWKTTASKIPAQFTAGEYAGQYDPAEVNESVNGRLVRGKTTFKELMDWGLTAEEIESVIAGDIPDTSAAIKDYCEEKGMEFSGIKSELQAITDTKQ